MYSYILFDLDGTLTNPGEGITNSVAYALKKYGIEVEDKTSLYKFIGPPLKCSFEKYYGFSEDDSLKAVEYYREYFRDKGIFENEIYAGAKEMLEKIKNSGRKIILATSKPEEFANTILDYFGISGYFDLVAGATMEPDRIHKTDVITYALKKCGITDLSKAVMIGDRDQDILGACDNGIDSIGVLYGYGDLTELSGAGATYIADSIEDIFEFL